MNISDISNSMTMWIAFGIAIAVILIQACYFINRSYKAGPKLGLSRTQLNKAVKTGAVNAVGPSVVIFAGTLSLIGTMGAPVVWGRLSIVGNIVYESSSAQVAGAASGVRLGVDAMTHQAYTVAVWTMVICSLGWVIWGTFSASRMDKINAKLSKGDAGLLAALSGGTLIGIFSALTAQHVVKLNKYSIAAVLGAGFMFLLTLLYNKTQKKWIKDWKLIISIFGAMIITALLP